VHRFIRNEACVCLWPLLLYIGQLARPAQIHMRLHVNLKQLNENDTIEKAFDVLKIKSTGIYNLFSCQ
jgi:hypothetical protein